MSHLTFHDAGAPGPGPGDSLVYHDEIYDAAGTQVAFEDGTAVLYLDPVDGSLREWLAVDLELTNGSSIFWYGSESLAGGAAGEKQVLSAVGTGGELRGMTGTFWFQLLSRPAPDLSLFAGGYTLCNRNPGESQD